jgi:hypothetical protein
MLVARTPALTSVIIVLRTAQTVSVDTYQEPCLSCTMAPQPTPDPAALPATADLQFDKAEFTGDSAGSQPCVACKRSFSGPYFHAQGHVVCPACAERIQSGQQAPPAISLAKAALYGCGAGLLGCTIYAAVAILFDIEFGLIAILVGWLVGKAIRHASGGLGGRPQQILAVVITYFSITTSYIPVYIAHEVKHPTVNRSAQQKAQDKKAAEASPGAGKAIGVILLFIILMGAAPFFSLGSGISGILTLFIIFLGLQRAWRLTGRTDLLVMGPYDPAPAQ